MPGRLERMEQWGDFFKERYDPNRGKEDFRQHEDEAPAVVREFYRLNRMHQTREFVLRKKREYLNTLVDDSHPDTDLSQIEHCPQTTGAIQRDGHPRWFVPARLVHDPGKIPGLFGEPQWAAPGGTFPVGCAWPDAGELRPCYEDLIREYFPAQLRW